MTTVDSDPPFSIFSGYLKSIRPDRFDEQAKSAMQWAFSGFYDQPKRNEESQKFFRRPIEESFEQPPYNYRRFGGDASLPRARYYSVCNDEDGNDTNTLVRELVSYVQHGRSGQIRVFDGADKEQRDEAAKVLSLSKHRFTDRAINAIFVDDDGDTLSPIFRSGVLEKNSRSMAIVAFPYQVDEVQIERAIDLRLPSTQAWFAKKLLSGLPDVSYVYDRTAVSNRLWLGESRPSESDRRKSDGQKRKALMHSPRSDWDGSYIRTTDDFFGILPFLIFGGRGGSPVTEAIGAWLRHIGAAGLIFPSARNDIAVEFLDGRMAGSGGWNFVDYRNAPPPEKFVRLIFEPDSWSCFPGHARWQYYHQAGRSSGSWMMEGRAKDTDNIFRLGQGMLSIMMFLHYRDAQDSKDGGALLKKFGADGLRRATADLETRVIEMVRRMYLDKFDAQCVQTINDLTTEGIETFDLFYILGLSYARLQKHQEAISAFQKAALLQPERSEPLANIGNGFMKLERYDQAEAAYAAALKINSDDKVARNNIASARLLMTSSQRS